MFKKVFTALILPVASFFSIPFIGLDEDFLAKENKINYTENSTRSDNPNNYALVEYEDSNNIHSFGNSLVGGVEESSYGQYVYIDSGTLHFNLVDGVTSEDYNADEKSVYLTLYDITKSGYDEIDQIELIHDDDYWCGTFVGSDDDALELNLRNTATPFKFGAKLEEFHKYRVGFNFNPGDDYMAFSEIFTLDVPQLSKFNVTPTTNSIEVEYELSNINPNVKFNYDKTYIELNGEMYELNDQESGIFPVIDNLEQAEDYSLTFGYEATKTIAGFDEYQIANEYKFTVSTSFPPNFGKGIAIASLVLLILLIIILLILIIIILYWNHQRRQISGMALVVGEDTQAYDPVYQHNYYQQEDESSIPNASSNQNEDVYGYFDEVQDNEYYQEEPYGYFDEVQEDYYEDDVYDIDNPDEGEWL